MRLTEFDFDLPQELIAQQPLANRSASRLLTLDRATSQIAHQQFSSLPDLLREGDLLVRNETRVLPARLLGKKQSGGQVEVLLVRQIDSGQNTWRCMTRSSKPVRVGSQLDFPEGIKGEVIGAEDDGQRLVRFTCPGDFLEVQCSFGSPTRRGSARVHGTRPSSNMELCCHRATPNAAASELGGDRCGRGTRAGTGWGDPR